jgi:hypothetical protein
MPMLMMSYATGGGVGRTCSRRTPSSKRYPVQNNTGFFGVELLQQLHVDHVTVVDDRNC